MDSSWLMTGYMMPSSARFDWWNMWGRASLPMTCLNMIEASVWTYSDHVIGVVRHVLTAVFWQMPSGGGR